MTNVAIQRKADNYEPTSGMKWPIRSFRLHLASTHGEAATARLFEDIQAVVMRSLLAVQRVITQDKHCFELYGCAQKWCILCLKGHYVCSSV